jgi:hypothetical protein
MEPDIGANGHQSSSSTLAGDDAMINLDGYSLREIFAADDDALGSVMLRLAADLDDPPGISSAFQSYAATSQ